MAKTETLFGRDIIKNTRAHWTRIETFATAGIPDLYGIKNKITVWLELKCIKQNSIKLSPLQISWNYNNFRHGGKNYYMVKDTRSKVIKLYGGDQGAWINEKGFKAEPNHHEMRPPYNWKEFEEFLFDT